MLVRRDRCAASHYYAGRSQDFRALLALLPDDLTQDGVVAVGYSLGGAMLLKYLGEEGAASPLARRRDGLRADRPVASPAAT